MGNKTLLALGVFLGTLAFARLSGGADTVVLNLDFESASYTLGAQVPATDNDYTPPLTWTLAGVPGNGDITTVAPAIANGGTKAMQFTDIGAAAPSATLAGPIGAANGGTGVAVGTLDLDYRLTAGTHGNLQYIRLLTSETSSSATDTALGLRFGHSTGEFTIEEGVNQGTKTPIGINPPTPSVDYHFTISWDSAAGTFSVTEVENPGPSQITYGPVNCAYNTGNATVKRIIFGSGAAVMPAYQIDNLRLVSSGGSGVSDWKELR